MQTMNTLAQQIHTNSTIKGFWPDWTSDETVDINFVLAKLALVHSEVSETLEALRKSQGSDKITEEVADILIRTLDLVAGLHRFGWIDSADIDAVVLDKMSINSNRPRKHGNLI